MSRENVDRALLLAEAFNRRDLDGMLALTHADVEIEPRLVGMEGGYRGHGGVRRWWSDLLEGFPDYTVEVQDVRAVGEMTLARIRGRGHGAGSGTPVVETWWQSIRWRDGRCVWWRNFATEAEAREAVQPRA